MVPPIDPGAMLATTHELADGSRVRLRLTRPSDLPRIEEFLERVGAAIRKRRFAFYDPRERVVVAATTPVEGREEIVGLADVPLPSGDEAVVSVLVPKDDGRGLDALLAEAGAAFGTRYRSAA